MEKESIGEITDSPLGLQEGREEAREEILLKDNLLKMPLLKPSLLATGRQDTLLEVL